MNYATMPAGPEMDRLVAERVMGWRYSKGCAFRAWNPEPGWSGEAGFEFKPSTNIAHAWEALEHLHAKGWHLVIINCPGCDDHRGGKGWACDACAPDDDHYAISVHADTAPLAICRAALMATGAALEAGRGGGE